MESAAHKFLLLILGFGLAMLAFYTWKRLAGDTCGCGG